MVICNHNEDVLETMYTLFNFRRRCKERTKLDKQDVVGR